MYHNSMQVSFPSSVNELFIHLVVNKFSLRCDSVWQVNSAIVYLVLLVFADLKL